MVDELDDPPRRRFRLHPIGGLCNRLRAMLSYRAAHGALDVIWDATADVSGASWLDVFLPLRAIRFVSGGWDHEDYAPRQPQPEEWEEGYLELVPTPEIAATIGAHLSTLRLDHPRYVATHIRRGDHVPNYPEPLPPLEAHARWATLFPGVPLWLAADCEETRQKMRVLHKCHTGSWIGGSDVQGLEDHTRNGTLAQAVVDLFMCAKASAFIGTPGSSFTDTIHALRRFHAPTDF